jgi:gliding motility-associated-like protein
MNVRHFLLLIFFIPVAAAAQYDSNGGSFRVDQKSGCAPFNLTITRTDLVPGKSCGSGPSACRISWGDGTPDNQDDGVFTHLYTTPGTYTLSINYAVVGPDVIQITVFPNIQPAFDVYTCSGNAVQVKVNDTNYESYIINYNDATPEVEVPRGALALDNHSFGSGGNKTITVRGKNSNAADNCTPPATKVVLMRATLPAPDIDQVEVTSGSVIDLQLTTLPNILYRLEIALNNGVFQNLGSLHNTNTATATGLDTDLNFYRFQVGSVDPCTGTVNYSPILSSSILNVTAQNNANRLTWTTSLTNIINFTINRDGALLTTTNSTTFLDTDVDCGTQYCYEIISNYADGISISAERCVTAISNDIPTPINDVSAVVGEGSVELRWQADATFTASTYSAFRQSNGGAFSLLEDGITTTQNTDNNYNVSGKYCYRIDYTDLCNNVSQPGIFACPIILSYTSGTQDQLDISWSAYTGWTGGVDHYELIKSDLQGTLIETINTGLATTYSDNDLTEQGYRYVVHAIPNDLANDESVSNEINAVRKLRFAYPKAFTPDNQGPAENETFKVFVTEEFISSFEMKIFNRWGEMIFSTTDLLTGWDGKFNGTAQPEGTYTFTAVLKDKTGRVFKRDGSVMLLRKKQ